jgi:fatty acid CoA ligase FadD9
MCVCVCFGYTGITYDLQPIHHMMQRLDAHRTKTWIVEKSHYWHLREAIDRETDINTPASFISRAFAMYANRPALGMPAAQLHMMHNESMVSAAKIPLFEQDGYRWLTYRHTGQLAKRIASTVRALSPSIKRGDRVGICGYNTFEWACVDFACMLAGLMSVGLHTTNNNPTTAAVINNASISVLFVVADRVLKHTVDEDSESAVCWSVEGIAQQCATLTHVIVMDSRIDDALAASLASTHLQVLSLLDLVDSASTMPAIELEPPEQQPQGGDDDIVSLLYTSGSSGAPKGVTCAARSFYNDIKQRTFIEPHITVSYIPLSHSSDRMKMWEFLGNGGRVGFAFYGASNWLAHERSKKTEMVQSLNTGVPDIVQLFSQVQLVRPTAMSCPPNIWNGLFGIYNQLIANNVPESQALAQVAALFGDRIQVVVTGGAPTAPALLAFVSRLLPNCSFSDSCMYFVPLHTLCVIHDWCVSDSRSLRVDGTTESGAIFCDGKPITDKGVCVRLDGVAHLQCDGDSIEPDRVGNIGEICVNSPNASPGYYRDEERTKQAFIGGGWFKTGDLGERLAGGKYRILGRIASAIKIANGSKLLFPGTVEAILESSPLVQQLYLHAEPDLAGAVAVVRPRDATVTEQQLMAHFGELAREFKLQRHELPAAIVVERQMQWSEANGMLTAQLKKRAAAFHRLYSQAARQCLAKTMAQQ